MSRRGPRRGEWQVGEATGRDDGERAIAGGELGWQEDRGGGGSRVETIGRAAKRGDGVERLDHGERIGRAVLFDQQLDQRLVGAGAVREDPRPELERSLDAKGLDVLDGPAQGALGVDEPTLRAADVRQLDLDAHGVVVGDPISERSIEVCERDIGVAAAGCGDARDHLEHRVAALGPGELGERCEGFVVAAQRAQGGRAIEGDRDVEAGDPLGLTGANGPVGVARRGIEEVERDPRVGGRMQLEQEDGVLEVDPGQLGGPGREDLRRGAEGGARILGATDDVVRGGQRHERGPASTGVGGRVREADGPASERERVVEPPLVPGDRGQRGGCIGGALRIGSHGKEPQRIPQQATALLDAIGICLSRQERSAEVPGLGTLARVEQRRGLHQRLVVATTVELRPRVPDATAGPSAVCRVGTAGLEYGRPVVRGECGVAGGPRHRSWSIDHAAQAQEPGDPGEHTRAPHPATLSRVFGSHCARRLWVGD
jgi:hypothetical protein